MNDWWNDPPEDPEPIYCPKGCVDGEGSPVEAEGTRGGLKCPKCGHEWDYPEDDPGPEDFPEDDHAPAPGCRDCGVPSYGCVYCSACAAKRKCHHGVPLDRECNECNVESDRAYDEARGS